MTLEPLNVRLKKGHHVLLFVAFSLLISACRTSIYQVYEVSSPNLHCTDSTVVFENDSVKVLYNFWENQGRVLFAVQNKLDKAIEIDWGKSKFIHGSTVYPYWKDETRITTKGRSWGYWGSNIWGFSNFSSNSVVTKQAKTSYLPPRAWIERLDYQIISNPDEKINRNTDRYDHNGFPRQEVIPFLENNRKRKGLL